jgi:hypothetical protein
VISASAPPIGHLVGRCELQLLVEVPGTGSIVVKHRDPAVPVQRWPQPGMVLPVDVHPHNPRDLSVRWASVPDVDTRRAIGPGPAVDAMPTFDDVPTFNDVPTFDDVPRFDDLEFDGLPSLDEPGTERLALPPLADREPSDAVRRFLYPTERYRGEWRRHGVRLAKELAVGAVVALLIVRGEELAFAGYTLDLAQIPEHEWVGAALWWVWFADRWAVWSTARLVLTTVRAVLVRGVFLRRVSEVPIAAIAHLSYGQSLIGRILGYGSFRFAGLGPFHPMWRIGDLPNPTDLYLQLVEECFAPEAAEARRPQ